ncbi:RodZ family helix-turn-helix domain-containing protein [Polynucleobacter sp. AP-Nino-20-G2]|uniref:helix-turn-helix domain-containing protein n=1 Tax=Polynucleobacter sp. AP-Nino-20-G2 TaxID=2576917 RepID=UPI001BFD3D24|nr:helix-turn-helix transcriptional regulator [Polynucleobacter sp. AP-Nino-20-G2]QWE17144.1 helix-turn-helix transcriptional regulator [Polynucleobacter sp. AP-Nino-20-G2]
MNKSSNLPEIRKEAFTKAREKLRLSTKDLGGMACLSVRQIEQIENGEMGAFYGLQIKFTAAKKVANLLGMSDEEAFDYGPPPPSNIEVEKNSIEAPVPTPEPVKVSQVKVVEVVMADTAVAIEKPRERKANALASQKKVLLWLAVLAGLVFAVINLQTLFFADKPEEVIVIKEEVAEPEPAAPAADTSSATPITAVTAAVPATATPEASGACPAAEEPAVNYRPEIGRKSADMVYVQAKSKQVICVIDATGKIQNKSVEAGVGVSFYGKPPFKVLTAGLAQLDIYFQGSRVNSLNTNRKTVVLEAAEVVAPSADRTDSQSR